jgi:hypothetical protein
MPALFGRYEAAALLAVEQANGGELAPLEQVIMAFDGLFGTSVTAQTLSESMALLVDAGLVEWRDYGLGLTVAGRRLIRHSGKHWSDDFPARVAEKLSEIDEDDLALEGELASPSEAEVKTAMAAIGRGALKMDGPPAESLTPSGLASFAASSARLFAGMQSPPTAPLKPSGAEAPAPPLVPSLEEEEEEEP